MGCISSKVMSRSISFREELNQSLQRRANGISSSGSDRFLAFVCTANPVANETCPKLAVEVVRDETWQVQQTSPLSAKGKESTDADDLAKRSKSCYWFQEHEKSSLASESNWGTRRSRSFHTVEEYDAMVEKMVEQTGFDGKEDNSLQPHLLEDEYQVEENIVIEEIGVLSSSRSQAREESNVEDRKMSEKGFQRKAIANGLESLEIPKTIEFPGVADLKEWLHAGGEIYSPGAYVTPKFGSYTSPISEAENKCIESSIFDPELVAAFKECMEQLEEEEAIIIKQIEENFKEESIEEKKHDEE